MLPAMLIEGQLIALVLIQGLSLGSHKAADFLSWLDFENAVKVIIVVSIRPI